MSHELGPLAGLEGVWEGQKGTDTSPDDDRVGRKVTRYRERMTFAATGLVANHEQLLYGLRYSTTVWPLGEDSPFHEDIGYWLWDSRARQIIRCFTIPRGVTVIAGGAAESDSDRFELAAEIGSETYGICCNRFLDQEFKTVRYQLAFEKRDASTIYYRQDTVLRIKGQEALFHHTDENTLTRGD